MWASRTLKKGKLMATGSTGFLWESLIHWLRVNRGLWRALAAEQLPADADGPSVKLWLPSLLQAVAILVKARF